MRIKLITFSIILAMPLSAQTLREAYQNLWATGVSVNQWEVQAEKSLKEGISYSGGVSLDQTADWPKIVANFDCVVPENCMKCEVIHPEEGVYDFTLADQLVDKALASGLKVYGHCLVWHSQCAPWFHVDKDGKLVSPEVLKKRLRDHINTIVSHFRGRITGWDVCNECFEDNGTLRKSLFYQILGPDYIPLAFQYAHEADPNAELYYNDYSMNKAEKVEGVVNFFRPLVKAGLPITSINFQGHMILEDAGKIIDQYDKSLTLVESIGLTSGFSELDMSVLPNPYGFSGANISDRFKYTEEKDPYKNGLPKSKLDEEGVFWGNFYKMLLKHKDTIKRVNFWCFSDANSWRNDFPIKGRTEYATLFDRQGNIKPFVKNIVDVVKK